MSSDLVVTLTVEQLEKLLSQAVSSALDGKSDSALGLRELRERYGFSRESLASAARDGLPVHRGPKGRILAFPRDVEAWIRSRRWEPSIKQRAPGEDDIEACKRAADAALGVPR